MAEDRWLWPVPGYSEITSGVGPRWEKVHKGIDISAPLGSTIVATRAGKVTHTYSSCTHNYGKPYPAYKDPAGCGGGNGNYIYIDHGDGYSSRYAHLTSLHVKVGDRVEGGQSIGTVGTTGDSTGPHLHFGIYYGDEYQDPELFVSPDNSMSVPSANYSGLNTSGNLDDTSNLVIVGQRVADVSRQPMHAYVQIYIGNKPLSTKPQYMQEFEITRYMGAGDTATFTIFDDTWSNIERDFSNNWNNVKLEYGYIDGVKSSLYTMQLTNYSLNFNSTGTFITVNAISHGAVENIKQTTISITTKNPTEAVKQISRAMGWNILPENFDTTEDIPDEDTDFSVLNDFPVTHILESIVPVARTKTGEILEFYLDSNNVVYFKSGEFKSDIPKSNLRTYIFQKGYDSSIIDLTFDIGGVFGGTSEQGLASGNRTSVFDADTREEVLISEDIKTVVTAATGEVVSMKADQSVPSIDSAGHSVDIARSKLYYSVKKDMTEHYTANMTIVGDPTIKLLDNIRIINVTDDGFLHHTSGVYMVKGIIDNVSGGKMTTTLNLIRNGSGLIENGSGVEIISPKILVK